MHRFFIPRPYADEMEIDGIDARHIYTVLKMKPGEKVQIVSDDGVTALAQIAETAPGRTVVKCLKVIAESHEPAVKITLAQGLVKGEKMDFIIQKAVELGVSRIVPLAMEHSVVRYDGDKAAKKRERWQKIAESAAKQSKRDIIPEVAAVTTMDRLMAECGCTTKIIAYECEDKQGLKQVLRANPQTDSILVIIGPEGGISEAELNTARAGGAVPVSLGRRILRAETAGLIALSAILYEFDELGG